MEAKHLAEQVIVHPNHDKVTGSLGIRIENRWDNIWYL